MELLGRLNEEINVESLGIEQAVAVSSLTPAANTQALKDRLFPESRYDHGPGLNTRLCEILKLCK